MPAILKTVLHTIHEIVLFRFYTDDVKVKQCIPIKKQLQRKKMPKQIFEQDHRLQSTRVANIYIAMTRTRMNKNKQ